MARSEEVLADLAAKAELGEKVIELVREGGFLKPKRRRRRPRANGPSPSQPKRKALGKGVTSS